jgi:hypothetical protein
MKGNGQPEILLALTRDKTNLVDCDQTLRFPAHYLKLLAPTFYQ